MNIIRKATAPVRFVARHKVVVAVAVTSAFWIYANKNSLELHNEFLREHGLYDEFYLALEDQI